jgi:hypothetical protein
MTFEQFPIQTYQSGPCTVEAKGESMIPLKPLLLLSPLLAFAVLTNPAVAALGQKPSRLVASSPSTVPRLLAIAPTARVGSYTVQETQLENGTVVREYSTPGGLVFAVAWQGPVLPDLDVLLGGYFSTFKIETEQGRLLGRRGGPVNIARDGLVVRSNGRMRNFFGHAYATDLIPAGLAIKDVLE